MNVFVLVVVYLAGVVTGGILVFFIRGPVVAFFRVKDEPAPDAYYVEVQPPAVPPRSRLRGRPWERAVLPSRPPATLPVDLRRELPRGGEWS